MAFLTMVFLYAKRAVMSASKFSVSAPGSVVTHSAHKKVPSFLQPRHFSGKRRLRMTETMRVNLRAKMVM